MDNKKSNKTKIIVIIIIVIFVLIGVAVGLYFLLGQSSSKKQEVVIKRLKTLNNLYLKFDTSGNQMLGTFTTTADKQNASEFIIDSDNVSYIQRIPNNSTQYRTYKLNVIDSSNNIYAEERGYNFLKLSRVVDNFLLKTSDEMKCLNNNYQICLSVNPSCTCLSLNIE